MRFYCSCILQETSHLCTPTPRVCFQMFYYIRTNLWFGSVSCRLLYGINESLFFLKLEEIMSIFEMESSHVLVNVTLNLVFGTRELPPVFSIS